MRSTTVFFFGLLLAVAVVQSRPNTDWLALLNQVLAKLVPVLTPVIDTIIKKEGLDPMASAASGSVSKKINLGVCTATASASWAVNDLTGLSTLDLLQLQAVAIVGAINPAALNATLSVATTFTGNLNAQVKGNAKAKCSFVDPSIGISGSVQVSGLTAAGTGKFESVATNLTYPCLKVVNIEALKITYKAIKVQINDLGIFKDILDDLTNDIIAHFKNDLETTISDMTRKAAQDAVNGMLPYCVHL